MRCWVADSLLLPSLPPRLACCSRPTQLLVGNESTWRWKPLWALLMHTHQCVYREAEFFHFLKDLTGEILRVKAQWIILKVLGVEKLKKSVHVFARVGKTNIYSSMWLIACSCICSSLKCKCLAQLLVIFVLPISHITSIISDKKKIALWYTD